MKTSLLFGVLLLSQDSGAKESFETNREEEFSTRNRDCSFGDFCEWWADDPGEIYRNKKNPWIQKVELSGRFHYQFGRVEGEDVRGNNFGQSFVEFRRARVSAEIDFLKYFEVEAGINLVDDNRYRAEPENTLDWGHDAFDSVTVSFDIGEALGKGPFDDIKLNYGRMKLRLSEEVHTSSNNLLTIERSAITDRLGGDESRPTGITLEVEKDDWTAVVGLFSNEAEYNFLSSWDSGLFFYGSLEWQAGKQWTLRLDHAHADQEQANSALGYRHGTALSVIYNSKHWGVSTDLVYGRNSHDELRNPLREGDFHGGTVTPWVWLIKDKLQLVGRYQYARAEETEGFRLQNRYARGQHFPPGTDLDGGYGDENHSFYLGLNWTLCEKNVRIMSGISHDLMSARTDEVSATSYLFAVRTSF